MHLRAGEHGQAFPAPDGRGHFVGGIAGLDAHQHGIDIVIGALRGDDGVKQPGHTGAVERRVLGGTAALLQDGLVVLQELRLLRILERNEHHRVAVGRDHAPRQPDHGVAIAADLQGVAQFEAAGDVGHRLVMAAGDLPSGHQIRRPARAAGAVGGDAHHHGAHIARLAVIRSAHLHGEVGDVVGAGHAGHGGDAAPGVVIQTGRFGVRPLRVFLHHPQIGAAVVEQHHGIVDHAAVHPGHDQGDADQQPQADAGEHELAPGMQNVASGQADHGETPGMRSTMLMWLRALSVRWL